VLKPVCGEIIEWNSEVGSATLDVTNAFDPFQTSRVELDCPKATCVGRKEKTRANPTSALTISATKFQQKI